MPRKIPDHEIIGTRSHRLLAIDMDGRNVLCECDCGTIKTINRKMFTGKKVKSCGCAQSEWLIEYNKRQKETGAHHNTTHGMSKTPLYRCWVNMKARCYDENEPAYKNYGGRGISVCDRWKNSFEMFLQDMGIPERGLTLDRLNPNGNYEPDNCVWADVAQQALNKRVREGSSCEYKGVSYSQLEGKYKGSYRRKHLGYSENALELAIKYDSEVLRDTGQIVGTNFALGLVNIDPRDRHSELQVV